MGVVVSLIVLAAVLVAGRLRHGLRGTLVITLSLALMAGMLPGCVPPIPGQPSASSRDGSPAWTAWSEQDAPNYVRLVGKAHIDAPLSPGQVTYAPLDAQGRAGTVRACITSGLMRAGEGREREAAPDPAGWPRNSRATIVLPDGRVSRDWFWNRCHLLAKSLGGEERRENLVTGTRMLNVGAGDGQGGMDVFEAGGATVIDDAYNANPDSMRAGLKGLERIGAGRRKLAVLGEMLELGGESEAEHASLGEEVGRAGVSLLACLPGTRALSQAAADAGVGVHDAPDAADALAWLRATLAPGDAVLLKGSHGSGVWRIADALREETK